MDQGPVVRTGKHRLGRRQKALTAKQRRNRNNRNARAIQASKTQTVNENVLGAIYDEINASQE